MLLPLLQNHQMLLPLLQNHQMLLPLQLLRLLPLPLQNHPSSFSWQKHPLDRLLWPLRIRVLQLQLLQLTQLFHIATFSYVQK
jgi:hypothetical protein